MDLDSADEVPDRAFNHDGDLRTGSRPALRRIDSRTDANFESRGPIYGGVYRASPGGASAWRLQYPIRHLIDGRPGFPAV